VAVAATSRRWHYLASSAAKAAARACTCSRKLQAKRLVGQWPRTRTDAVSLKAFLVFNLAKSAQSSRPYLVVCKTYMLPGREIDTPITAWHGESKETYAGFFFNTPSFLNYNLFDFKF